MEEENKVTRSQKFRIYPNEEQKLLLAKTFGCNRFVWNQCLGRAKKEFEEWKENPSLPKPNANHQVFNDYLNQLKAEHEWLYEVPAFKLVECLKTR